MKKLLFFLLLSTLINNICFATIRRVGYNGLPVLNVDFTNMQEAHDASNAGDTIQIYGGGSSVNATKQLVYIGFGYNLDVHEGLQTLVTNTPSTGYFNFKIGSEGSIVTGLYGSFYLGDDSPGIISNITFLRCMGAVMFYNNSGFASISNIKIISCVITNGQMNTNDAPLTDLQVYNCIVTSFSLGVAGTTASFINCVSPNENLIGGGHLTLNDASVLVKNCIFGGASSTTNINTVYESNFFSEAQPNPLPAGSNNRWNQDWAVIFNRTIALNDYASYYGYEEFDENYYILKAGSPAINGGFNGASAATNCGIFGGELAYIYKPSGIPAIPAIYQLSAPGSAATGNPYNVTISVRSNN